ncbi:MAG TPA: NAD-dependent epimerase/dehydratase family protein [Anaerolineae bacterium]|nr:NAD-dependent epimerase/dehydratase family protein [Anaerolineae bacterium]
MILVTGGAGFIGRAVLRRLIEFGFSVRTLLQPSNRSPSLPKGVPVDVTLAGLTDRRGVRASLVGIDTVIHLAGIEGQSGSDFWLASEVEGTHTIAEAASEAGIRRLIFLSHIGADQGSAYPTMQMKAMAEEHIRACNVPYTILRTAILFGRHDNFTTSLAMLLGISPLFFPIPGNGSTLLQPLWVDDLATAITWALDEPSTLGKTIEIGGPEYISFKLIVRMIMKASSAPRILLPTRQPYLRAGAWLMEKLMPRSPINPHWLDYLAVDRTTDLNTLPHIFSLQPSRMEEKIDYLGERNWGWELLTRQFTERRGG